MLKAIKRNNGTHTPALLLAQTGLFEGAGRGVLETFAAAAIFQNFPKGKILFQSGGEAHSFYIIQSGWVKLYRETLDGTQAVIDVLTTGHVFGKTAIFEENRYPYNAEVVEDAEVFLIPLFVLKNMIDTDHAFAKSMLVFMARHSQRQTAEIEHRTIQSAPQRIGCFFLRLIDQRHKGAARIFLSYDKTLIAARLGMQPETFSRALAKLSEAVGVRVRGAMVEIDSLDRLAGFSCSACTSNFPCQDSPAEEK